MCWNVCILIYLWRDADLERQKNDLDMNIKAKIQFFAGRYIGLIGGFLISFFSVILFLQFCLMIYMEQES